MSSVEAITFFICGINMYNPKQLYLYKNKNLTYLIYDYDCFNNE